MDFKEKNKSFCTSFHAIENDWFDEDREQKTNDIAQVHDIYTHRNAIKVGSVGMFVVSHLVTWNITYIKNGKTVQLVLPFFLVLFVNTHWTVIPYKAFQ